MIRSMGRGRKAIWSAAAACALLVLLFSTSLAYAEAPHVATTTDPDTCAMCHRAHTGPGDFGRIDADSWEMTGTALGVAVPLAEGDTALCYVCHGVDALGSGTPVGADFAKTSAHSLAPAASPYGPSVKYCSSCHDSHGASESAPGVSYSALLRSRAANGTPSYRGSAYCGTCHAIRPESRFPGVNVYEKTLHFGELPLPESGTQVTCSICHENHGSAVAPLINTSITPPAIVATATVTANDRTFCTTCHATTYETYPGTVAYAKSAHAVSSAETTIPGEWAADDAERLIGECQVCHAAMGRDDGSGNPIPSLLERDRSKLCEQCHDTDGPAETDLVALAYPAAASAHLELVAGFSPETTTSAFGTVALWGSDAVDAAPRSLIGPRFYSPAGTAGPVATGDLDADGATDVIAADRGFARITVFSPDPLKGISAYNGPGELVIDTIAEHMVVANVTGDSAAELAVVSGGTLYLYQYDILGMLQQLDTVAGLGANVTGLAAGDLDGDGRAELVVTDAAAPAIHVLTEATPGTLQDFIAPVAAKAGVRGPSVGDIDDAAGVEIAVANADEAADQVTVYSAAGNEIDSASLVAVGAAKAWATLVADVLPGSTPVGTSGLELVVAANGGSGDSFVDVFSQVTGGGIVQEATHATGTGFGTGSLTSGDIDGDGAAELIAGNGGFWSRDGALAKPPSIQVFQHNLARDDFGTVETLPSGGVERAGSAPYLAVADLGGVGPSRHPVAAVEDSHLSTETASVARHVECADCHNSHEATSTVDAAPDAYGRILGVRGATAALAEAKPIRYEYELCYKCHSAYRNAAGLEGARDIAAQVDPANASVHAIETVRLTSANNETFVAGWDNNDLLYCTDCHSSRAALPAVQGPHASTEAPILRSPYLGATPSDADGLCYDCHKYSVYYTGGAGDPDLATGSLFRDAVDGPLHELHVKDQGFGCASCHASHGVPGNDHLVRTGITFDGAARTCTGPCHPGGVGYTP